MERPKPGGAAKKLRIDDANLLAQDFFKSCMRLIEQEIPIRQDECRQINPLGDSSVALNMVQK